jgi:sialic acid synthase SpsE
MNLILEVGLNHFGKVKESVKYLKFFLKSNFTHITYQIQKESYYEKFKFKLPIAHYVFLINKIHKKGKKIGLAVADINSCYEIAKLNFDFYKILSVSLTDKLLVDFINKRKKPIFLSCGTASNNEIKKCLNNFKTRDKKRITLIHTSLSYEAKDQNLKRLELLYKIFPRTAYGHHYSNFLPIILSLFSKINSIFIYIKALNKKGRHHPDEKHAFAFKKIDDLCEIINESINILGSENNRNSIIKTINDKKISF